ncbi:MAG: hypothetical protein K0R94_1241 [Burkholderiales bacterium]|jgi:hypothetical protein|nr:hypothetical protein [Burkholderiales bacterium]
MENINYLGKLMQEAGFEVLGHPSAIVQVKLGSTELVARYMTKFTLEAPEIL